MVDHSRRASNRRGYAPHRLLLYYDTLTASDSSPREEWLGKFLENINCNRMRPAIKGFIKTNHGFLLLQSTLH